MRLIVGLGNPEPRYVHTRHNLGFLCVQALAEEQGGRWRKASFAQALTSRIVLDGIECSLILPLTYMNNSGVAVKQAAVKSGVEPGDIIVVYDDMDLDFGDMRLRASGSAGGHNGIKSVIEHLGSKDFARLRLGVGNPKPGVDPADHVLSDLTPAELKKLPGLINNALSCLHIWGTEGVEKAMNEFNKRKV
ncbi:MAG TPA: aminoacyl-tRNA hydrolase [Candidatus Omnitrophota bacterium]|nr:aminoacyl-tRNA hydrolase [Candidatus Omnitrophota bacterium]